MNFKLLGLLFFLVFAGSSIGYGADLCQEYSNKEEYDKAIEACTATLGSSPDARTYSVYDNRGFAYSKQGRYDEAVLDFTKAIELNPKDVYAYNNRSFAYIKKGQHDNAVSDATNAIALDSKNALSFQARALAYEGKKQEDKAIADWGRAIEINPVEYHFLNRARLRRAVGQYDEAIADYDVLVKRDPDKATGYWFRSAVYYEKGSFADAVRDYRKLIEIYSKDYPDVKLDLLQLRLLNAAGKLSKDECDKVMKELGSYVVSNQPSSAEDKWWRTVSKYYLGMDGVSENKLLEEARNGNNEKAVPGRLCDAYYSIGEKKLMEGDRKAAEESFNKSLGTDLPSFSYRFAKAMLRLMQEGKLGMAFMN